MISQNVRVNEIRLNVTRHDAKYTLYQFLITIEDEGTMKGNTVDSTEDSVFKHGERVADKRQQDHQNPVQHENALYESKSTA